MVLKNNKFTFYNLLKITYNFNYDLLFGLTWAYVILYFTKNMIKNIKNNLIPILYYLGIISLFALFILDLNLLIFIINIIILLNVLFVISYCLYNLFKNSIFWKIFAIFVLFCTPLFINLLIIHILIDEWNFNSILWNDFYLEGIKQEFIKLKIYIFSMKDIFTIKKEYIINFFENYIINIYMICIYYITLRLLFYIYISNIFINIFKFLKYLYNLTYYYIFSSYFFHIFLLKKIISLFITILLIMFSNKIYLENFVSYIFSLNPLIFIISVIIILGIFVISYYLYNLFKNTIFWEIFKIFMILFIVLILGLFIIFNIDLFILNNTICTLSPRLLNPIIQNPNSENIQENLEYLQEKLVAERKDYNIQKNSFDANVNRLSDYFNNNILHIEFSRTNVIVQFKSSDNSPSINTWINTMSNREKEVQEQVNSLIKKVNEIEALDAKIYSITQTNFDNREYQSLILHLSEYRGSRWYLVERTNKTLNGINENDLKNMDLSDLFFKKNW